MTAAADPPKPNSRVELYTQEPMVNWLGPVQLLQTGLRAAVATTLGAFADPREVQAALHPEAANPPIPVDTTADGSVWIDYVADTGDGWNATYSVAWCISRNATVCNQTLPPAQVLLLGGDQVYPTPAGGGYRTRFMDPFRSAFPAPVPPNRAGGDDKPVIEQGAPLMLATPGNHDWYDGLRAFAQLFCNQKPIGRWRTQQRTSYFVLKLPNGWWIWGLDLQLESAIDRPQRQYFEAMAAHLQPGDRVVLCAPEPSWVDESERVERENKLSLAAIETQTPRFRSLKEIEELLGRRLAVVVAGDSHHYARYVPPAGAVAAPQRITCGGGGAFLLGTHQLPQSLRFFVGGAEQRHELRCAYPDAPASKLLRNRAWRLPTRNLSFCALLATLYLLFAWLLQSASKVPHVALDSLTLMESLAKLPLSLGNVTQMLPRLFAVMAHSPSSVVFAAAIVLGAGAFTRTGTKRAARAAFAAGMLHGLMHLVLAIALLWSMGRINLFELGRWFGGDQLSVDAPLQVALFFTETLLFGGLLGGLLFGVWMVATNAAWGLHGEEVFSSQRIADCKCFLRMRFDADRLTIYPLKIDRVCTRWKVGPGIETLRRVGRSWRLRVFTGSGPRFVPAAGELGAALIEPPIHIAHQEPGIP